jgi:hypothetical protein
LDGTLAHYENWEGPHIIGKPIRKMVLNVKRWIKSGKTVKIITARVGNQPPKYVSFITEKIQDWLEAQGLPRLQVTSTKDLGMVEMWDDRCIQVVPNSGLSLEDWLKHKHYNELKELKYNSSYGES